MKLDGWHPEVCSYGISSFQADGLGTKLRNCVTPHTHTHSMLLKSAHTHNLNAILHPQPFKKKKNWPSRDPRGASPFRIEQS